ncbi:MAG: adenylyltransferase/cytidyltransferase family protein [bacterium]|nr:adenylyltransferase/cytidyltransferase family protein [bacterium]
MKRKHKVGFTCGALDLCHAGHILMLKEAKQICDYLIVGLQEDPSTVKDMEYRDKLKNTPVMSLEERRIILEGIKYVDEIFTYTDEEDLYNKLKNLKYDVRILGTDWKGKKYTGHDLPHHVYFNERNHNYSTTELRQRVFERELESRKIFNTKGEVLSEHYDKN